MQRNENVIKKQTKLAEMSGRTVTEPHRFVKHNAMDCGRPNCALCGNPRRIGWGNKRTVQEKRMFQGTKKHHNGTTDPTLLEE